MGPHGGERDDPATWDAEGRTLADAEAEATRRNAAEPLADGRVWVAGRTKEGWYDVVARRRSRWPFRR